MIRIVIIIPIRGGRWEMFARAFEIEVELTFPFGVCHGDIDRCEKRGEKSFVVIGKNTSMRSFFPFLSFHGLFINGLNLRSIRSWFEAIAIRKSNLHLLRVMILFATSRQLA